jgi:sulfur carrier protein ThiS
MSLKLNIRLYGTLSRSFDEYDHASGLDVILPDESSIGDLLVHLNILPKRVGMVVMDGKSVQKDVWIKNEAQIKILQPIAGG